MLCLQLFAFVNGTNLYKVNNLAHAPVFGGKVTPTDLCNDCIQSNELIPICDAKEMYKFRMCDIRKIKSYYINSVVLENNVSKQYYGTYLLKSDIEKFSENNLRYKMRVEKENDRQYFERTRYAVIHNAREYDKSIREEFVRGVFNKAGYFESIYVFPDVTKYISSGYTDEMDMYDFEVHLLTLIGYPINQYIKLQDTLNERYESKNRINFITSITNLDDDFLRMDNIYTTFVDYGINKVRREHDYIQSTDDFILYIMQSYC